MSEVIPPQTARHQLLYIGAVVGWGALACGLLSKETSTPENVVLLQTLYRWGNIANFSLSSIDVLLDAKRNPQPIGHLMRLHNSLVILASLALRHGMLIW